MFLQTGMVLFKTRGTNTNLIDLFYYVAGKYCMHVHANRRVYIFKTPDPAVKQKFIGALVREDLADFSAITGNDSALF